MKILVTGGAGYIGSHTVAELLKKGHQVVVFDNLSTGHKEAIKCPLVEGDLLNRKQISEVFAKENFDGVIHFAGLTLVGESMKEPSGYFETNLQGGVNLLEAMRNFGVNKIVFSSSSSIYGFPEKLPVTEEESKKPMSVYGESKLIFETILQWYDSLFGIKNVCLRYFNACGDSLDGTIGEDHTPETHLIPSVFKAVLGKADKFTLFGDDYKTPDGSCIRDYIHVADLADIHIRALVYLINGNESNFFNAGVGKGYSNKEIVEMIKKISGVDFKVEVGPRRTGDPDAVYADNTKIRKILKWEPRYSDLETIIKTAWTWHKNHPQGYSKI
jgi:UDP-glucose 4-epimerase